MFIHLYFVIPLYSQSLLHALYPLYSIAKPFIYKLRIAHPSFRIPLNKSLCWVAV